MKINLKKIGKFLKTRLKEKSTYVGMAAIAVAVGKPEIATEIVKYSDIGLLILGGSLLSVDTTNPEYTSPQEV
jgi:galactitol-specific phosphotransferase system IIC component